MGGSYSGTGVSVQVLVLAALTVTLCAAARYMPVLGILVSLLSPTPILLVTLRHGLRTGLLALGLSTLSLALLFGSLQSSIFFAEYGVMALVMAEAIRRQWSVEKTLLASTVVPSMANAIVMVLLLSSADFDLSAVKQHFEADLNQALRQFVTEESGPSEGALRAYVQEAFETIVLLLPALFVLSTAAAALLNYGLVRMLWQRLGGQPALREVKLAQWKAPEVCVWVLIASGICYFVPLPGLRMIGLNGLLLVSLVYLVQGLSIMGFYLNKASVPSVMRTLAYVFLVIQPLLLLGVAAFGLFDLWFDFRRTSKKREETS
ncbi:MAG TPA: YybS family protein [Candidatus Tectomicrobia bacterium]|nr:YybS family protein [Candidatus Tectomicrobia bacterium]